MRADMPGGPGPAGGAPRVADEASRDAVARIVGGAGSSFASGMRILPAPRRRAIHALYAFCRVVDDIADGPGDSGARLAALAGWRDELRRVAAGAPRTDIGAELVLASARYGLPADELHLILDGMEMDAHPIVAPEPEALDHYVRCVAGAVGVQSMRIFGAWRGAESERFALSLAHGVQLVNILRDVAEDADRGRLYLPRPVLDAAGLPHDPALVRGHPGLPAARALLARQARRQFGAAVREVPAHARLPIVPALMMMGPYERLLARMEADWTRDPPARARWRKVMDGLACVVRGGGTPA